MKKRDINIRISPSETYKYEVEISAQNGGEDNGEFCWLEEYETDTHKSLDCLKRSLVEARGSDISSNSNNNNEVREPDIPSNSNNNFTYSDLIHLGQKLFQSLINVHSHFNKLLPGDGEVARLRIMEGIVTKFDHLPWEYLCSEGNFFSLQKHTPIIRYPRMDCSYKRMAPIYKDVTAELPLEILFVAANPNSDSNLNLDKELNQITKSLESLKKQHKVSWKILENATSEMLRAELLGKDRSYHVLHFMGHGHFDRHKQTGSLHLRDKPLEDDILTKWINNHQSLKVAFLNSCKGAQGYSSDLFSGTARQMLRAGIPIVIAMQFAITDSAAVSFSNEFYKAIIEGYNVEDAVTMGRLRLYENQKTEWGTPALFVRVSETFLLPAVDQQKQVTEKQNIEEHNTESLFDSLLKFNHEPQKRIVLDHIQKKVAAYWIRPESQSLRHQQEYHSCWLIKRLTLILGKSPNQIVVLYSSRNKQNLWSDIGNGLGLPYPQRNLEGVTSKLRQRLETGNVYLVIKDLPFYDISFMKSFLEEFWMPLAKQIKLQSYNYNTLSLFLLDQNITNNYQELQRDMNNIDQEYLPIEVPEAKQFSLKTLKFWLGDNLDYFPIRFKQNFASDTDTFIQREFFDNGGIGGAPGAVLEKIYDQSTYFIDQKWSGSKEEKKWMNY